MSSPESQPNRGPVRKSPDAGQVEIIGSSEGLLRPIPPVSRGIEPQSGSRLRLAYTLTFGEVVVGAGVIPTDETADEVASWVRREPDPGPEAA